MDPHLARRLEQLHGVARLKELRSAGIPEAVVRRAVDAGELDRPRHGLYALPTADPRFVQARSTRSLLTCVSAAELYGLWVLAPPEPGGRLHVLRATGAGSPDAVVHRERRVPPHPTAPLAGLADVVLHALRCLPELEALVIAECAVVQREVPLGFLRDQLAGPRNGRARAVLDLVDLGADSLLETIARTVLRRAGFQVEAQVWIEGIGWVDLLVEGWIIVELDGKTHEERVQRGKDRVRDRQSQLRGLVTLRYGYADVVHRSGVIVEEVARILGGRPLPPGPNPTGFGRPGSPWTGAPARDTPAAGRKQVGFVLGAGAGRVRRAT
jgi:very-short-patch-repair endonuclease